MSFDKVTYWKNRKAGKRGQGEKYKVPKQGYDLKTYHMEGSQLIRKDSLRPGHRVFVEGKRVREYVV